MSYVIAEIGSNHEGDMCALLQLVKDCIEAGADAIKLQAFTAADLVSPNMPSLVPTHKTQLERMKSLEVPLDIFYEVRNICEFTDFIVSPFGVDWVEVLADHVDKFKVASGELTNLKLLNAISACGVSPILSTGMADYKEIILAMRKLDSTYTELLHCVSLYPCPIEKAGLNRITALNGLFPRRRAGYSDHCIGTQACLTAAALGAHIIEKHVTTEENKKLEYGDHIHSITASELEKMIKEISKVRSSLLFYGLEDLEMRKQLRRGPSGLRGE